MNRQPANRLFSAGPAWVSGARQSGYRRLLCIGVHMNRIESAQRTRYSKPQEPMLDAAENNL